MAGLAQSVGFGIGATDCVADESRRMEADMPDIQLRFHKDMLVLSAPVDTTLARQGIHAARDRQYLNLMEPDVMVDALRLEEMAGAQCLVTPTEDITKARLAHVRMDGDAAKLAHAAVQIVAELKPQHILAEIGPCGLPLDASSKASLNENRAQYADAARAFEGEPVDALFLNGFTSINDLRCALMGVKQASDKPVFASVIVGEVDSPAALRESEAAAGAVGAGLGATSSDQHVLDSIAPAATFAGYELVEDEPFAGAAANKAPISPEQWPEAVALMQDLGASVVGFETAEPAFKAEVYAREAARITDLPLMAQLRVTVDPAEKRPAPLKPLEDILDYTPDTMAPAAVKLYGAGVQFLRATGLATPSFTGALAATVFGLDVRN